MDVSVFYTRSAAATPAIIQAGEIPSSELSGAKDGAAGFLDLLLASLAEGKGQQEALTGTQDASGAGAPLTEEEPSVESFLASLDAETAEQIKNAIGAFFEGREVDAALLARIQTIIDNASDAGKSDLMGGLLNLLIAPGREGSPGTRLEADKAQTDEDMNNLAALLTANLTPEQIADLARRLSEEQKTAGTKNQGAAFLAALLTQDQNQTQAPIVSEAPALLPKAPASLAAPAGTAGEDAKTDSAALTLAQTIARIVDEGRSATKSRREARFADLLGGMDSVELSGAKLTSGAATPSGSAGFSALKSVPMNGTQKDSSGLSTFPGGWGLVSGIESTFSPDSALAQWLERLTAPAGTTGATSAGPTSSSVGQSALSGAHPASQIVAAAMIRTAQNGETKTLTLNLEPPELGRVDIRIEMGRDRSIKTVLSVEKPETLSLLQRDAHLLERALQNAGFDAGGDSLQFELAQDGGAFDANGNGSNGGYNGDNSGSRTDDSDAILIETHLDWFIDPQTGAQRYDLYV